MVISAVLLFDEDDSRQLIEASVEISQQTESLIQLSDSSSLPHITIVQFEATEDAAHGLKREVLQAISGPLSVNSTGLASVPSFKHSQMWVELQFVKSELLKKLQRTVINTDFAKQHQPISYVGDQYRPHCTLALLKGIEMPTISLSQQSIYHRQFNKLHLAVGLNGPNFTYNKTI